MIQGGLAVGRGSMDGEGGVRVILAGLLLGLAACQSSGASLGTKARSFAPVAQNTIDGTPITDFLATRTVKVIIEPKPTATEGEYHTTNACAVPIAPDGYMLTVAHALDQSPIFALIPGSSLAREFRVVWNGFDEEAQYDLALIHCPTPPPTYFEFADESTLVQGLQVVTAGFPERELVFAMGSLARDIAQADGVAAQVRHSAPLRNGDSGGPLISLDGKLVAINYGSLYLPLGGQLSSKAIRPDIAWLNGIIEADRQRR